MFICNAQLAEERRKKEKEKEENDAKSEGTYGMSRGESKGQTRERDMRYSDVKGAGRGDDSHRSKK
jgi:hypothetical protein